MKRLAFEFWLLVGMMVAGIIVGHTAKSELKTFMKEIQNDPIAGPSHDCGTSSAHVECEGE